MVKLELPLSPSQSMHRKHWQTSGHLLACPGPVEDETRFIKHYSRYKTQSETTWEVADGSVLLLKL